MSVEIISQDGSELTLAVKVDISGSMLSIEEKIQSACNEAGIAVTQSALQRFDADGSPIIVGGIKYTARTQDAQEYQTPYGAAKITRYVFIKHHREVGYIALWNQRQE